MLCSAAPYSKINSFSFLWEQKLTSLIYPTPWCLTQIWDKTHSFFSESLGWREFVLLGTWLISYHWVVDQRQTMYILVFILALHRGVVVCSFHVSATPVDSRHFISVLPHLFVYADLLHTYFSELGCVYMLCVRSCVVLCPCWSGVLVSIHLPFWGEQLGSCWGVSFRPYSDMLQLVLYFLNYRASPFSSVVELGLIPSAKCSFWTRKYPYLQNMQLSYLEVKPMGNSWIVLTLENPAQLCDAL